MQIPDYVFFNLEENKTKTEINTEMKLVAFRTNPELQLLSTFEYELDNKVNASLVGMLTEFEAWVGSPYTCKFITFEMVEMQRLTELSKEVNYKSKTKDFYKIMNYQYWNIKNEMSYRMGVGDNLSLEDFLDIYGLSFVGNGTSAKQRCFNTLNLVQHFKFDVKRNKDVFVKIKHPKEKEQPKREIPRLTIRKANTNGEAILVKKMAEGWHISIECKSKGKGYGLTFEGVAYPTDVSEDERVNQIRVGEAKSLEQLMIRLFDTEDDDSIQKEKASVSI
ncbi:hypothetical protein PP175_26385 (plasmid) [Aneurinibacillus sp. Ricciae_BoGa-3]|uniref:hypothetical protein n=1 Tax=Aneurinibacillus sp. Ricciae_BoGa-3 TaxID=3022697 RepID=UPI0023417D8A|nr:hypothetical protein [Aneurinibacillus sp. Ricciae_BoGa-3]WCK57596.1 hypothetical protein PP175_26385 [Aneurinibacillus sp. Ricciae_BoGa-3]